MRDHAKLREHWNAASGGMQERLNTVNRIEVAGPRQPIQMSAVRACLTTRGKWRVLEVHALMGRTAALRQRLGQPDVSSGAKAAAFLVQLVNEGSTLQIPQFATLQKLLDELMADGMLGANDISALWALSETREPWWQSVYRRPVNVFDLIESGLAA
jgi:hypothetical protein